MYILTSYGTIPLWSNLIMPINLTQTTGGSLNPYTDVICRLPPSYSLDYDYFSFFNFKHDIEKKRSEREGKPHVIFGLIYFPLRYMCTIIFICADGYYYTRIYIFEHFSTINLSHMPYVLFSYIGFFFH